MNDAQRFEHILDELRALVLDLGATGVDVMLIGGQVIALEARARGGDGVIQVTTQTGVTATRGYSMEPDLLFDLADASARADAIFDVLRARDFKRVRDFRWLKHLSSAGDMFVDLFMAQDTDAAMDPGGLTRLPSGDLALARARLVEVQLAAGVLEIKLPDPVGFLAMKLDAKLRQRPRETKDCFDIYAYVMLKGVDSVRDALRAHRERPRIVGELGQLFESVAAPGVSDVVAAAGPLDTDERALLARAVVDAFDQLLAR